MNCQYEGCHHRGNRLLYPDDSPAYFCDEHQGPAGFCYGCGGFYGGVESFSFGDPKHFCDDCRHDPDLFPYLDGDEYEDDWEEEPPY